MNCVTLAILIKANLLPTVDLHDHYHNSRAFEKEAYREVIVQRLQEDIKETVEMKYGFIPHLYYLRNRMVELPQRLDHYGQNYIRIDDEGFPIFEDFAFAMVKIDMFENPNTALYTAIKTSESRFKQHPLFVWHLDKSLTKMILIPKEIKNFIPFHEDGKNVFSRKRFEVMRDMPALKEVKELNNTEY